MGGSTSAPLPENVQELIDQGVCRSCIQRMLSLDRQQMTKVHTNCDDDCAACSGIMGSMEGLKQSASDAIGRYSFYDMQVELPRQLLAKDMGGAEITAASVAKNLNRKNLRDGKVTVPVGA